MAMLLRNVILDLTKCFLAKTHYMKITHSRNMPCVNHAIN